MASLPPVLLLHGAGGGAWEWNVWRRVFAARGHAIVAPDLQPVREGLAATRLSDYVAQVEQHWGADPPLAIGASLGGLLALIVAARRPCAALVLVNPLPPLPEARALAQRDWPERVPWGSEATLAGTRRALSDADEATCLYAMRRWRDEAGAVLREAYAGVDVPLPASEALAKRLKATFQPLPGSHVGPLLGRGAADAATVAAGWVARSVRFTTD